MKAAHLKSIGAWTLFGMVLAITLLSATPALAQEGAEGFTRPPVPVIWWIAPIAAIIALVFAA